MRSRLALAASSIALVCCGGKVAPATGDGGTGASDPPRDCRGVDLENDAHNCGWCGHDCRGGACRNLVCAPTEIATRVESANSIALDADYVYWTSAYPGTVKRARKEGGGESIYFASAGGGGLPTGQIAKDVALDATRVFWLVTNPLGSFDAVFVPQAGAGTVGPNVLPGSGVVLSLATCGPDVWWSSNSHVLMRATAGPPSSSSFGIDAHAVDVACSGPSVAWLDLGRGLDVEAGAGRVVRFSGASGGTDPVLSEPIARPAQLTIRDDTAYFTSGRYSGLIQSVPLKGGATTTLVSGQLDPQGIAVDDRYVYWVTVGQLAAEGTVMRSDKRVGGAPQFLAFGQRKPIAIAVDDAYVYWASQGDAGKANGGVYRVAK